MRARARAPALEWAPGGRLGGWLRWARRSRTCDGRPVGVYPETKHPSYFDGIGLSLEEPLVRTLRMASAGITRQHTKLAMHGDCDQRTPALRLYR